MKKYWTFLKKNKTFAAFFSLLVTEVFRIKVPLKFPSEHVGASRGSALISCQNFLIFPLFSPNLGEPPPLLYTPPHLFLSPSPLSPVSPLCLWGRCLARRESAWLAFDTKGGLFREMFPFLMSDGARSFNIPRWYLSGSWLCFKATA